MNAENNDDWEISSQVLNRERFIDYSVWKYAKQRKWGASHRDEDIVSALWKHGEIEFVITILNERRNKSVNTGTRN